VSVSAANRNAAAVVTAVCDRRNAFSDLFSSPALAAAATLSPLHPLRRFNASTKPHDFFRFNDSRGKNHSMIVVYQL